MVTARLRLRDVLIATAGLTPCRAVSRELTTRFEAESWSSIVMLAALASVEEASVKANRALNPDAGQRSMICIDSNVAHTSGVQTLLVKSCASRPVRFVGQRLLVLRKNPTGNFSPEYGS